MPEVKKNVIAFMNMKGGVGKTTLCVNLADCLAKHFNKKILIIDIDPQFNSTQYLVEHEHYINNIFKQNKTIRNVFKIKEIDSDVLTGTVTDEEEQIDAHIEHISENLDLLCGDLRMIDLDTKSPKLENRLKKFIKIKNIDTMYDFIFIDCPPTYSIYTIAAYNASQYYILPVKPDFLSVLGINLFQRTLSNMSDDEHKIECLGMVFTLVQNYPYINNKMEKLRAKYAFYTFDNNMKQSTKILDNAEKHICIYNSDFKNDIIKLAQEFLDKYNEAEGI
ncbi:ParA family protein [Clostridium cagae]|uniref:ParA family protein n=1 Tax=Clostridium cagae TaxID=2080751 RepID=UPI000CF6F773|nr:ParA family protein [Clostridium cagae]